jgi:hypothetical protein
LKLSGNDVRPRSGASFCQSILILISLHCFDRRRAYRTASRPPAVQHTHIGTNVIQ